VNTPNGRPVRVRFAPSPTGHLHIGSLRVALFNWLFARHHNGTFIIRIEDTDIERSKQEYTESIIKAFEWVNITSDEPIAYQTARLDLYKGAIDKLLASGNAYWSDPAQEENGKSVIRFKIPSNRTQIQFNDLVRGPIAFDSDQIGGDFVIARADGSPLYNFVVVVDDIDMRISHVIRGEDHISNTPKQILLYEALGAEIPHFAHLPMILGPTGAKLSKRDAATSVIDYRTMGFLSDALCNYLVRLSWAHGDQEIFSRDEMVQLFSLDHVHKSGAIFDMIKLRWVNSVYLKQLSAQALSDLIHTDIDATFKDRCATWKAEQVLQALDLYKDRSSTLGELHDFVIALYTRPQITILPEEEKWDAATSVLLDECISQLALLKEVTPATVEPLIKGICKQRQVPLPALAKPIRFALTGSLHSPSVYALVALLGTAETIQRIEPLKNMLLKI